MAEYIKRQAILDALPHVENDKKISLCGAIADFIVLVSDIPAADVAPVVHGHLVISDIPDSILCMCSVCGYSCGAYTYRYCPNCGAKMDEEAYNGT